MCPEDYPFTEVKFLQRVRQIQECGGLTCSAYKRISPIKHDIAFDVRLKHGVAEKIVSIYKRKVQTFKFKHKFPVGANINQPKVAALFYEAVIEFNDSSKSNKSPIFLMPRELEGTDFSDGIINEMLWTLVCSILMIDIEKINLETRRDFMICTDRCRIDTEWLAFTFQMFCKAYGKPWDIQD